MAVAHEHPDPVPETSPIAVYPPHYPLPVAGTGDGADGAGPAGELLPADVPASTLPAAAEAVGNRNPYLAYLDSLDSAESRTTMKGCLDRIARLLLGDDVHGIDPKTGEKDPAARTGLGFPWHVLRAEHTIFIRARLDEQVIRDPKTGEERPWSHTYRNKHLTALRQVITWAWRLGLSTAEEHVRAADVRPFKGTREPAGEHIEPERVGALLDACDAHLDAPEPDEARRAELRQAALRDAAMIEVLYSTGVRRAELARLALRDYDPVRRSLHVRGKGNKERRVFLTHSAAARLADWLAERGREPGGLFPPFTPRPQRIRRRAGGRIDHLTGQTISHMLTERAEQAKTARPTAHDFRRTVIGELLNAGVDLATAQALAGHASPVTTARYDRRDEDVRRAAVDRLSPPPTKART
ncbi:tyrosine-type recombinase/integrase [Nonomuraea turkmeniaca]|uniref:tyrosine-type recombinase/integrase n=1 Tax=Nonomuraea turkmeniaca TaxID=103838 RepID=UPI001FE26E76|nr:tyrosine-type recombinase/integrase [Nonomuraea turkmeniaca]